MKRLILASTLAALTFTAAQAADAVVYEPAPTIPTIQAYDWSGGYIGAQAGYDWSDARAVNRGGGYIPYDPSGLIGGVYAGYNYHFAKHLIVGVDADFAWSDAKGSSISYIAGGAPLPSSSGAAEVNWSAAIRARIGYSVDRFMPYIAGGIAFANMDRSIDSAAISAAYSHTYRGWTIGGGLEYAFDDNLILRGEYRYSDFGHHNVPYNSGIVPHSVGLKTHDMRFGISYKF